MKTTKKFSGDLRYHKGFCQKTLRGIYIDFVARGLKQDLPFSFKSARSFIEKIFKKERIRMANLTVVLAGNVFIRSLNKKFLLKDEVTDCLAFDMKPKTWPRDCLFGDIVISVDAARIVSKKASFCFKEELARYVIHGILHLAGFDDTAPLKRKKMWKRQEELVFQFLKFLK